MQQNNGEWDRSGRPAVAGGAQRRAYDRPRIVSRENLEVLAATCDPGGGGKGSIAEPTCTNFFQS